MRQASSGARAGQAFAAPGAERQFQRGFESDDASGQVLDMVLLLGDRGGELFNFVGELDRSRKCVPDPFGQTHFSVSFVPCSGPGCGLRTVQPAPAFCRWIEWPAESFSPPAWQPDAVSLRPGTEQ